MAAVLVAIYMIGLGVLAWHHTITGDQALAATGAVLLPLIGALAHSTGVNAGANAASGTPNGTGVYYSTTGNTATGTSPMQSGGTTS